MTDQGSSFIKISLLIGFFCLSLAVLLFEPPEVQSQHIAFEANGVQLQGRVWIPQNIGPGHPGVVLVHGVNSNKDFMNVAAQFLADHRIVAMTFDLGGYGESQKSIESDLSNQEETLAAVKTLRSFPFVDASKVSVLGHSMGGTAVFLAGLEDSSLWSVAALGMRVYPESNRPCRVFSGVGLYDAFHPPAANQNLGFKSGCGHTFAVSPVANHQVVTKDAFMLTQYLKWFQTQLSQPLGKVSYRVFYRQVLFSLLLLNGVLLLLFFCETKIYALMCLNVMGGLLLAAFFKAIEPDFASEVILYFWVGFLLRKAPDYRQLLGVWGKHIGVFFVVFETVNVFNAIPHYWVHPVYLFYIPLYLLQLLGGYALQLQHLLRPLLFESYSFVCLPSWLLMAGIAIELIWPACIFKGLGWVSDTLEHRSRALLLKTHPKEKTRVSWKTPGLLVALLGILGSLLWQRYQMGFVTGPALQSLIEQALFRWLPIACLFGGWLWFCLKQKKRHIDDASLKGSFEWGS